MDSGIVLELISASWCKHSELIPVRFMFKRKLVFDFVPNVFAIAIVAGYMVGHLVY